MFFVKHSLFDKARFVALALVVVFIISAVVVPVSADTMVFDVEIRHDQTEARSVIDYLNSYRSNNGLGQLTYDYTLEQIAMLRVEQVADNFEYESHHENLLNCIVDGVNSNGECIALGCDTAYSAYVYWAYDENDLYTSVLKDEEFVSCAVAHIYFNGMSYWALEFGKDIYNTDYVVPNDNVTHKDYAIDSSEVSIVTNYGDTVTIAKGESKELSYYLEARNKYNTFPLDPSEYTITNWRSSQPDCVEVVDGVITGKEFTPSALITFDWSYGNMSGSDSIEVRVEGYAPTGPVTPTPTPDPNAFEFKDMRTDEEMNIFVTAGEPVTLRLHTNISEGEPTWFIFASVWRVLPSGSWDDGDDDDFSYTFTPTKSCDVECEVTAMTRKSKYQTLNITYHITVGNNNYKLNDNTPESNKNLTISGGSSATLQTVCSGVGTLTYKWYIKSSTDYVRISGSGSSVTVTPNKTFSEYRCVVSDTHGNTINVDFNVTVASIRVLTNVTDIKTAKNTNFELTANAESTTGESLTYNWYKGDSNTVFKTGKTITDKLSSSGTYRCVVSDSRGNTATIEYTVTVCTLTVTTSASSVTIFKGETTDLTVTAQTDYGNNPTYRWFKKGASGTTLSTGSTYSAKPDSSCEYGCEVTDSYNTKTVYFTVTVNNATLTDRTTKKDYLVSYGQQTVLSVDVTSNAGSVTYKWQKYESGTYLNIPNQTSSMYSYVPTASGSFRCVVTDRFGNFINVDITVTVPTLTLGNNNTNIKTGEGKSFTMTPSVTSSHNSSLSYAWTQGSSTSVLSSASSYTTSSSSSTTYKCTIRDEYNNAVTVTYNVTVYKLTAGLNNSSLSIYGGDEAQMSVNASSTAGNDKLSYRWYIQGQQGTVLSTSSSYSPKPSSNTTYCCEVSDTYNTTVLTCQVTVIQAALTDNTENKTRVVKKGASVTLEVNVSSNAGSALHYQWQSQSSGGSYVNISNQTSKKYTYTANSTGYYRCVVTDDYGNSKNVDFTITVPTLTAGNNTTSIKAGKDQSFTLTANAVSSHNSRLYYSWTKGSPSSTSVHSAASYSTSTSETTKYYCKVTDDYNNSITITYTVTVIKLTATQNMTDISIFNGDTASMSVTATSDNSTITYKWYAAGSPNTVLSTGSSYNPKPSSDTTYYCEVSDTYNTTTLTFVVTVQDAVLTDNTTNKVRTVSNGENVTLETNVTSNAGSTLTYKWQKKSGSSYTNISGAASSSYTFKATASGNYRCVVTDTYGNTKNVDFVITVPTLTTGENTTSIKVGEGQVCSMEANAVSSSNDTLSYSWTKGSSSTVLSTGSVYSPTVSSTSTFYCKVSDTHNNTVTIQYNVTVCKLTATQNSAELTIFNGDSAFMSVTASTQGGNTITYRWYDSDNPSGNLNSTKSYSPKPSSGKTYYCEVSDSYNTKTLTFVVTVKNATLTDNTENKSRIVSNGENVELEVNVVSDAGSALKYKWYKMNAAGSYSVISNQTSSKYSFTATSSGNYRCVVTDNYNNRVNVDFDITLPTLELGVNETFFEVGKGDTVTMTANVVSSINSPLTYEWTIGDSTDIKGLVSSYSYSVSETTVFKCKVKDNYNNSVTITYNVTVYSLTCMQDPGKTVNIFRGDQATMSVDAVSTSGNQPTFTWYQSGNEGTVLSTASTLKVSPDTETRYVCKVSDQYNTEYLNFTVVVNSTYLINNTTDTDKIVKKGQSVTLQTNVTSNAGNITYQWQKMETNGTYSDIAGASSSSYTYTANASGNFRCVVSNSYDSLNVSFTVTVPTLTKGSNTTSLKVGEDKTFKLDAVVVSSIGSNLTYTWILGNTTIQDAANAPSYSTSVTGSGTKFFKCKVTDEYNNTVTISYTVKVYALTAEQSEPSLTIFRGDKAEMTITASTTSDNSITYDWYIAGSDTKIGSGSTFSPSPETDTVYRCDVTDGYGSKTFTFTVSVMNTSLTDNTVNKVRTVKKGDSVTLAVDVVSNSGSTLSYTWQEKKSGKYVNIQNQTASSYVLTANASGSYRCVVSDSYGNTVNVDFSITVPTLTKGTNQTSVTVGKGLSFTLTANAVSSVSGSTLHYKWKKGSTTTNIKTATFSGVADSSAVYTCEITDDYNNSITISYTVTVIVLEVSSSQQSFTIFKGDTVSMSVNATSDNDQITYFWYKEGTTQKLSDKSSLTIAPSTDTTYCCEVSDGYNTRTLSFDVSVVEATLTDRSEGKQQTVSYNSKITLEAKVESNANSALHYKWEKKNASGNYVNASGTANAKTYKFTATSSQTYRCTVTDDYGNTKYVVFEITVPTINVSNTSNSLTVGNGSTFKLNANATSSVGGELHYTWKKGSSVISNATQSSLSTNTTTNATYYCVITDNYNNSVTVSYSVTVVTLTATTTQSDYTIFDGGSAKLSVTASSEKTIQYNWYEQGKENVKLSDTSSCTVKPHNDTTYYCKVTDGYNSKTLTFNVTVRECSFTDNSKDLKQTVSKGASVTLKADVTSNTGSVKYQWQIKKSGSYTNISGATSKTYSFTADKSASYRCVVSDDYGNKHNVDFEITVPTLTKGSYEGKISVKSGDTFTLTANAKSSLADEQLEYAWTKSGSSVILSSSSSYSDKASSSAKYKCTVSDHYGNTVVFDYEVTVYTLTATGNSSSFKIKKGETAELKVTASTTSSNQLTYSWYTVEGSKSNKISGASSSTYKAKPDKDTKYRCDVSDSINKESVYFNVSVVTPTPTPVTPTPTTPTPATPTPVTPTPYDAKTDIRGFVERLYNYVLGRASEPGGIDYWTDELYCFRQTGAQVAIGFIDSAEFAGRNKSDEEFVDILYRTFFDREPEAEGKKFWVSQLKSKTMTRHQVAMGFIDSPEWADKCAEYGIRSGGSYAPSVKIAPTDLTYGFVERMYVTALGRSFDKSGRDYWADGLANFKMTGEQVGVNFFLSPEMEGYDLGNDEFIERLYLTFMDRPSDKAGKDYWMSCMKKGMTKEQLVLGFTRSPEFVEKCIEARILPY